MNFYPRTVTYLKKHWLAVVLGGCVGLMVVAPWAYFALHEPAYRGIALYGEASEEYYTARVQEVYDGDPLIRNLYTPFKDVPYLQTSLGEALVAYAGMFLHLSAAGAIVASKFFFPLLATICIYALVFLITRSRETALLAPAAVIFGMGLLSAPQNILPFLQGVGVEDGLFWGRPINPEVSGVFLFAILALLFHIYFRKTNLRPWHMLVLGLLIGTTLYVSVFTWAFVGVLLVVLSSYALIQKRWYDLLHLCSVGSIALLGAIPFILNLLHAHTFESYANVAVQQGVAPLHTPELGVWLIALPLLPALWWPKKYPGGRSFFILTGMALLLTANQQILTGIYEQPWHFHSYITKPLVLTLLTIYAGFFVSRIQNRWVRIELFATAIIGLFAYALLAQVHFYDLHAPLSRQTQAYAPVISYLNKREHEVVFTSCEDVYSCYFSDYVAQYTSADAPHSKYSGLYLTPPGYFKELVFLHYRLLGIPPHEIRATMVREKESVLQRLFGEYYYFHAGTKTAVPADIFEQLAKEYAAYAHTPIPQMMQDLRITMLIHDNTAAPWNADLSDLQRESINGRFIVYR